VISSWTIRAEGTLGNAVFARLRSDNGTCCRPGEWIAWEDWDGGEPSINMTSVGTRETEMLIRIRK
jgi:hypothetical protein